MKNKIILQNERQIKNKIPNTNALVKKMTRRKEITEIKNKIPYAPNFVSKTDLNTKINDIAKIFIEKV